MMKTFAIKWDEKILVTNENKDNLIWYKFVQEESEVEEIKQKYKNIIYSKYSITDQNNMNARITEINTLAKMENRDFTALELEDIALWQAMFTWIKEQRQLCADEIALLTA